jgi:hypothetical protein
MLLDIRSYALVRSRQSVFLDDTMPDHHPPQCLNCSRPMVLEKSIPRKRGEPDVLVWCCQHCRLLQSPEQHNEPGDAVLDQTSDRRGQ